MKQRNINIFKENAKVRNNIVGDDIDWQNVKKHWILKLHYKKIHKPREYMVAKKLRSDFIIKVQGISESSR